MLVDYIDRQVIVSLFPYMKAEWGLSDKELGALVSVMSVTVALGALPVALIADRHQPRQEHRCDGDDLEPRDDLVHGHAQLRARCSPRALSSAWVKRAMARSAWR